jgi:hypothetical protein
VGALSSTATLEAPVEQATVSPLVARLQAAACEGLANLSAAIDSDVGRLKSVTVELELGGGAVIDSRAFVERRPPRPQRRLTMPFVTNYATGVLVWHAPTIESRSDALEAEVSRDRVDVTLREDIERDVRLASRTLGIDPAPRVRWLPNEVKGIRGIVFDDALHEVWVAVQDPERTRDSALHELKHVHQLRGDRYKSLGLHSYEQRQTDADQFARTWTWEQVPPMPATPRKAVAMHAQPSSRWPQREMWQHKGVTYVECDRCEEGVPLNTRHRCKGPAYSTKAIDAALGRSTGREPGRKYGKTYRTP